MMNSITKKISLSSSSRRHRCFSNHEIQAVHASGFRLMMRREQKKGHHKFSQVTPSSAQQGEKPKILWICSILSSSSSRRDLSINETDVGQITLFFSPLFFSFDLLRNLQVFIIIIRLDFIHQVSRQTQSHDHHSHLSDVCI